MLSGSVLFVGEGVSVLFAGRVGFRGALCFVGMIMVDWLLVRSLVDLPLRSTRTYVYRIPLQIQMLFMESH